MIPLFKSHYSVLKSILTLESPSKTRDESLSDSIAKIVQDSNLDSLVLVEDTMAAYLPASLVCKEIGKKLVYGYRVSFVSDTTDKTDSSFEGSHKNIIFPKNKAGYYELIALSTLAAVDNFYKEARLSYSDLLKNWTGNLALAIPFYDSFLHKNLLHGKLCIPEFNDIKPIVFLESNELPFDYLLEKASKDFANKFGLETQKVKSIYYKNRDDYEAYVTLKCLNRKVFGSGRTLANPGLEHMSSREFCWESFTEQV